MIEKLKGLRARDRRGKRHPAGALSRLLLDRLENGEISTRGDAHAAHEAAVSAGRRDLARKARRIQRSLARSHKV